MMHTELLRKTQDEHCKSYLPFASTEKNSKYMHPPHPSEYEASASGLTAKDKPFFHFESKNSSLIC
eukprot:scaffold93529_cov62-Attheya_sp.AAC.4